MNNTTAAERLEKTYGITSEKGVNPAISDSSTYFFDSAQDMSKTFEGQTEGMYLYSRHSSPSTNYLARSLAEMENMPAALVTASGMSAIAVTLMQLLQSGEHIVAGRTIYGGSYALLKNFLPRYQIETSFVNMINLEHVSQAIKHNTKVLYFESLSNPLLEIPDFNAIKLLAQEKGIKIVVDNTFTPLLCVPKELGADVVIHSLTKFINGTSDALGGVVCGDTEFVEALRDVNSGASMLLGPTMDAQRAASILKNMRTLSVRMQKHSQNALYLATKLESDGFTVLYPGLRSHPQHALANTFFDPQIGYGGLLALDMKTHSNAAKLMEGMQERGLGYLAVSLGFSKTLFSASGSSTSSEIPENEQQAMGLTSGLIRFSIGLDENIAKTYVQMKSILDGIAEA